MIRLRNIIVLFSALFFLPLSLVAQEEDDLFIESSEDTLVKEKHPSKRAMLYSAILPGAGQVYNHTLLPRTSRRKWNVYWKVPLIYAAFGGSMYMLVSNQVEIGNLKKEYRHRELGNDPINYLNLDNQSLIQLHNQSQTQRDLFILTSLLVYVINILDASVEAHFINFDVSDDLSMHVYPTSQPGFRLGMGVALRFKR